MCDINTNSIMNKISEYTKALSGPAYIDDLFDDAFVKAHSNCLNVAELFATTGVTDQASYDTFVDTPAADEFARVHTDFDSWNELFSTAARNLARKRQTILRANGSINLSPSNNDPFFLIQHTINFSVG